MLWMYIVAYKLVEHSYGLCVASFNSHLKVIYNVNVTGL